MPPNIRGVGRESYFALREISLIWMIEKRFIDASMGSYHFRTGRKGGRLGPEILGTVGKGLIL